MTTKKLMQAAAGNAGGEKVYVEDVFSTHLYAGNSSTRSIDNNIDLSGEGGLVWIKDRSTGEDHVLIDSERGASKAIRSNSTPAEHTDTSSLTSFDNDGFSLGTGYSYFSTNYSGRDYVSWSFRKQEGFFDVVTFSTTGGGGTQAISHNLGSIPGFILIKKTSAAQSWFTFHKSVTSPNSNWWRNWSDLTTAAFDDYFSNDSAINSAPTATAVTLGSYFTDQTADFVMYVFAEGGSDDQIFGDDGDEAIIKTGSFSHTSGTPTFVNCGFEAAWVIAKRYDSTDSWWMADDMRGFTPNGISSDTPYLAANTTAAEGTSDWIGPNAQGFDFNYLTGDYIYIAIRRGPMKEPSAGTDVYNYQTRGGGGSGPPAWIFSHPVDWFLQRELGGTDDWYTSARLTQGKYLKADETDTATNSTFRGIFDFQNGFGDGSGTASAQIAYAWRRYPKVFDTVVYEGNGSNSPYRTITHNLGVAPELVIIKNIDSSSYNWGTGFNTGNSDVDGRIVYLNLTGAYNGDGLTASATTVTLDGGFGGTSATNTNGDTHLMLMFASLAGISKVGAYVGTGSAINVDCGFSGGARWVMVKRTDATADWYIVSSGRGFGKHLTVDSDADESSTAVLDTLSAGFTVRSDAGDDLNASGGKYLYLAFSQEQKNE